MIIIIDVIQAIVFCLLISPLDEVQKKNKFWKFQTSRFKKTFYLRNNITEEPLY